MEGTTVSEVNNLGMELNDGKCVLGGKQGEQLFEIKLRHLTSIFLEFEELLQQRVTHIFSGKIVGEDNEVNDSRSVKPNVD